MPVSGRPTDRARRTGSILVVEDDPELRELLDVVLKEEAIARRQRPMA